MGIVNRTEDFSEQRKVYEVNLGATATGITAIVCQVPWPAVIEIAQVSAFGISGTPNLALICNRFIPGAGATAFTLATGTSNVLVAYGTSGVGSSGMLLAGFGVTTPGFGSTLLQLSTNDVVMLQTGVANSAVTGLSVNLVLRPLQDVRRHFGML